MTRLRTLGEAPTTEDAPTRQCCRGRQEAGLTTVARWRGADDPPDLYASDISWGRLGMSVGIVEHGDEQSYRELAQQAIHRCAELTLRLDRATQTIVRLREDLRRSRPEHVA